MQGALESSFTNETPRKKKKKKLNKVQKASNLKHVSTVRNEPKSMENCGT